MKINITKEMARFIVNEKAGKVICIFDNTAPMFLFYAQENLPITPMCDSNDAKTSRLYTKLLMPNKFVGIASCNPEDEFSVETGKLIAFTRAKDKIQNSFFKRANLYVNTIDSWLNRAMDAINNYGAKIEVNTARRHNKIASLIGESNEK